ncbi:MAG: alpha-(1-_3)-arabinofuranosyltransferase family protein, partial [Sporichthyaceae bacterium]
MLQALGASAALSMKLLRLLLLTVAALGAARLFRHLAPGPASRRGGLVAAVAYVANPYTLVAGAALGILWPYAVLPWLTWAVVRAVEQGRGWRWPAAAALLFMATTGMNAGVIAAMQLVALPVFVVLARSRSGRSWRQVAGVLGRCVLLSVVVSAYWLVPTVSALGAGTVVVNNSETNMGIATTSSLAEVLRGLGLWPLYGADPDGAWVPEHVGYVVSLLQLMSSYLFTGALGVAVVVSRGRLRLAALAGVVVSAVLMVGLYPAQHPTVFGRLLSWAFDHVPGLEALRTTNKSGAALVLCVAVLAAGASARWVRRETDPWRRRVAATGLLGALALSVVPAFNGNLYTSPLQVPGYWRSATTALDKGPPEQRVWFVPGEVDAAYRWTPNRPDDLSNSLLSRPAVVRTVIPVTSEVAANYLAAADTQLQEGTLPTAGLSTYARYLGVGDLLLRNDVAWERVAGARPVDLQPEINGDPGLRPKGNFGEPGQNVTSPDGPSAPELEASLPPLQHYSVARPVDPLHAAALTGTVLLVGDAYAVSAAQDAGLLPSGAGFRYLADLSTSELTPLLGPSHRVVLTDTNRRRTTVAGRLVGGQGPLLAADDDPGSARTLWSPADQTVLTTEGGTARATQVGSVFGTLPDAAPENAFDHDLTTAWQFGDFRTGVGQQLTLTTPEAVTVRRVSVQAAALGSVQVARLRVSAGGRSRTVVLDRHGRGFADLSGVRASRVTLTVDRLRGDGFNRVGVAEVAIAGVSVRRVARTPLTLQRSVTELSTAARTALARTPLDVVLTRVRAGRPAMPEEEPNLERDVALPDDRTFRSYGIVRPTSTL